MHCDHLRSVEVVVRSRVSPPINHPDRPTRSITRQPANPPTLQPAIHPPRGDEVSVNAASPLLSNLGQGYAPIDLTVDGDDHNALSQWWLLDSALRAFRSELVRARTVVRVDTELLLASPDSASPGEAAQALRYSQLEAAPGTLHAHADRLFYATGPDFVSMFVGLWPNIRGVYSLSPQPEVSDGGLTECCTPNFCKYVT